MRAVRDWENPPGKTACFFIYFVQKAHQTSRLREHLKIKPVENFK